VLIGCAPTAVVLDVTLDARDAMDRCFMLSMQLNLHCWAGAMSGLTSSRRAYPHGMRMSVSYRSSPGYKK
jgi:hypothetical protein